MSLGGGFSVALNTAVTNSIASGVTYAVAAGNDGVNACNYSPASTPAAITVGSTDLSDSRSYFSNIGTCLDIFAPGSNITSTWNTSNTATNTISGTSMATPHVAGVAALYLATHPTAAPAAVASALIANSSANKVVGPGAGSPNRLLYSLFAAVVPTPVSPAGSITDKTPTFTWTKDNRGNAVSICRIQGNRPQVRQDSSCHWLRRGRRKMLQYTRYRAGGRCLHLESPGLH